MVSEGLKLPRPRQPKCSRISPSQAEPLEPRTLLAAADLDPTFSEDGKATMGLDFPGPASLAARRSALQADGKVVHAGLDADGNGPTDFLLARMNADGSPDVAFGGRGDGVARADLGASVEHATDVDVQRDGKLVVVGHVFAAGVAAGGVARLNPDGTLDASFGSGGKVLTSGPILDFVAMQQDNKILAAGGNKVSRLLPNGQPDPAFASPVIDLPGAEFITGILPLPGFGVLVAGGVYTPSPGNLDRFVARLTPAGTLDPTFGAAGNGTVVLDSGGPTSWAERCVGVAVDADGRVYVAGTTMGTGGSLLLTRLSADGRVDTSFGSGGTRTVPLGAATAQNFIATPQGQFLLAGSHGIPSSDPQGDRDFLVMRLSADGSPDPAFGNGGMRTIDFGLPWEEAMDVHVDGSGRIVVTGGVPPLGGIPEGPPPPRGAWAAARLEGGSATAPPAVTDIRFNISNGNHTVRVTFSEDVRNSLDSAGDLVVRNVDTGQEVTAQGRVFSGDYLGGPTTVEWQFTGPAGSLPNANYRAVVSGAGVSDSQGNALGGDVPLDFFVLSGDINRDRTVSGDDFSTLARNFGRTGQTYATGDLNGDGRVDGSDFSILAANFGKSVRAPLAAAVPAPAAPVPPAAAAPAARAANPLKRRPPPRRLIRRDAAPRREGGVTRH